MKSNKVIAEKIGEEALQWLTNKTNRSINQTKFLFELLGNDWYALLELEEAIKMFQIMYCPSILEEALYLIGKYRLWKEMKWSSGYVTIRLL